MHNSLPRKQEPTYLYGSATQHLAMSRSVLVCKCGQSPAQSGFVATIIGELSSCTDPDKLKIMMHSTVDHDYLSLVLVYISAQDTLYFDLNKVMITSARYGRDGKEFHSFYDVQQHWMIVKQITVFTKTN
jgi:hypothetical protein